MSNFEKAVSLLRYADLPGRTLHPRQVEAIVTVLQAAGLLAPDVRIIRTLEELEKLDPDTVLIGSCGEEVFAYRMQVSIERLGNGSLYYDSFPAAVIATGDQVRDAREAMELDNG